MELAPQPPKPAGTHTSLRPAYLAEVQRALDPERLDAYAHPDRTKNTMLDRLGCYSWNVALCEALYPSLHTAEVLLRNSVYRAVDSAYRIKPRSGLLCWLDAGKRVLTENHAERVAAAKAKLGKHLAERGLAMTTGRLIAELNFGFWTYLFDADYGYRTNDPRLWPRLLEPVFPHLPASVPRERDVIEKKLIRIRELRNRAFHHEPIWKYPDLQARYDEILDLINWISPSVARTVVAMDRFWHIYQDPAHRHIRRRLYVLSGAR
jgi:hypothetical protein